MLFISTEQHYPTVGVYCAAPNLRRRPLASSQRKVNQVNGGWSWICPLTRSLDANFKHPTCAKRTSFNKSANKWLQACSESCQQDVFAILTPSCCKKFWTRYQTWYKIVLTSLIQIWYNNLATNLATHDLMWLNRASYQTCWNSLITSLLIQQVCYNLLTSCLLLVDSLKRVVRTQLVDNLFADLLQDVIFLRVHRPTFRQELYFIISINK